MDKKVFEIPELINTESILNVANGLGKYFNDFYLHDIEFDFQKVRRAFPFGTLFLAKVLKTIVYDLKREYEDAIKLTAANLHSNDVLNYLKFIGFFKYIGIDEGVDPGVAPGSETYIPIRIISRDSISKEADDSQLHIGDIIEREAQQIAKIVCHAQSEACDSEDSVFALQQAMSYSIREVIRNSFEHSEANEVIIYAQYFPSLQQVEIAIMDYGVGIFHTLSRKYSGLDPMTAIEFSLKPGISWTNTEIDTGDKWQNSGFGLYIVSEICKRLPNSQFCILSNNAYTSIERRNYSRLQKTFDGTTTMIKLAFSDIYIPNLLEQIIQEGEKELSDSGKRYSASKASKTLPEIN